MIGCRWVLFLTILQIGTGCDLDPGELPEGSLGDPEVCLEGPVTGTCIEALWGECGSPVGACSLGALTEGAAFLWESGHGVGFTPDPADEAAVLVVGVGPGGESCFTGVRTLDPQLNQASTIWTASGGETFHVVEAGDGSVSLQCPDERLLTMNELEPLVWTHCLQAGVTGGTCDFAGLGGLYAAQTAEQAPGNCGARAACPPGSLCCPGGGGSPYCSTVCL